MKKIFNQKVLTSYLQEHKLDELFNDEVIKGMELYQLSRGEILCSNGDKLEQMFFLVKGKLKIFTTLPNGKSLLLRFNTPLSIIGDIEFTTRYEVKVNVESVFESKLIGVSFELLHKHFYNNPEFLRFILEKVSYKLYSFSNITSLNLLYPLENRLASYLLSIMYHENNFLFYEDMRSEKLTDVADLLGTSYRHLNRVIKKMCSESIIERTKEGLYIKDLHKLKELSIGNIYE
ncbi:transcriptional regulator [Bacillus methanolicus PB1]|uniref:Transcriptional regulator n=1 Tax=Bacillus methanolicus PB1 TaxID=997296 RepID=I3E6H1_BACMT|nr:helix-turn-helix domain-containing protein [Bacillus methanolicus]EIJ82092.1 transcriptional regulator [Bacillus methanolicus PB1]